MSRFKIIENYDWTTWLIGIWRSLIGGGCNAILSAPVSMGIDPQHFNFTNGLGHELKLMGGMFIGGAILHMIIFLSTHNSPDAVVTSVSQVTTATVTQTTETTQTPSPHQPNTGNTGSGGQP